MMSIEERIQRRRLLDAGRRDKIKKVTLQAGRMSAAKGIPLSTNNGPDKSISVEEQLYYTSKVFTAIVHSHH